MAKLSFFEKLKANKQIKSFRFTDVPGGYAVAKQGDVTGMLYIPEEYKGKKVLSIADRGFQGAKNVTDLLISDTIRTIGASAFYGCEALGSVHIPASVTSIGAGAFWGCSALAVFTVDQGNPVYKVVKGCIVESATGRLVAVPAGGAIPTDGDAKIIGKGVFANSDKLETLEIPEGVIEIGDGAFENYKAINSVVLPESLQKIGKDAFSNCQNLCEINLPAGLTDVADNAFGQTPDLTDFTIADPTAFKYESGALINLRNGVLMKGGDSGYIPCDDSVTAIAAYAFASTNVKTLNVPANIKSIGDHAFYGCSCLREFTLPYSITAIEPYTFANCSDLREINIPYGVESIGEYAFSGCDIVKSVYIPDSVEIIDAFAFENLEELTEIFIPDSVIEMGTEVFCGCDEDMVVKCQAPKQPKRWDEDWNSQECKEVWGAYR